MLELYLDTSTPTCILRLNQIEYRWLADRDLADGLLSFILEKLTENSYQLTDITKLTFMSGPGSFMGLRIGATVVNVLAHELNIPLEDHHGQTHSIIKPAYGKEANISQPKK